MALFIFIVCFMLAKLFESAKGNNAVATIIWAVGLVLVVLVSFTGLSLPAPIHIS